VSTGRSEGRSAVYRLYGYSGTLLYIGVGNTPFGRFDQHARQQYWWPEVHHATMEWFPDRASAERAETAAIKAEKPLYNLRSSTTRKNRAADMPPEESLLFDAEHLLEACSLQDPNYGRVTKIASKAIALVTCGNADSRSIRDFHRLVRDCWSRIEVWA